MQARFHDGFGVVVRDCRVWTDREALPTGFCLRRIAGAREMQLRVGVGRRRGERDAFRRRPGGERGGADRREGADFVQLLFVEIGGGGHATI